MCVVLKNDNVTVYIWFLWGFKKWSMIDYEEFKSKIIFFANSVTVKTSIHYFHIVRIYHIVKCQQNLRTLPLLLSKGLGSRLSDCKTTSQKLKIEILWGAEWILEGRVENQGWFMASPADILHLGGYWGVGGVRTSDVEVKYWSLIIDKGRGKKLGLKISKR